MLRRRATELVVTRARAGALARARGRERGVATSARVDAGMGPAIEPTRPPTAELPEEAELTWDAGDSHPEPALDNVPAHIVTKERAATYLASAFAFLGGVYGLATLVDKPSTVPFAPKTFPYNGLEVELGKK